LLKAGLFSAGAVSLTGCERIISRLTREIGHSIPSSLAVAMASHTDPDFHLLSRAGYGPWPGDLDRIREIGRNAWIEEQLNPNDVDDAACDLRARRFETLHHEPGTCFEYKKPVLREELSRHTLLRAVYSRRQLFEVMAGFWSDHLNINIEKGNCIYLKPADDRTVIRAHAMGRFKELIRASATSPAMLVYLDGNENRKASPDDVPNENYARELLELHTLGVDGGYTQRDVYEAARALTGWRVRSGWRKGTVYFDSDLHDDGEKTLLGHVIPAGGAESDVDRLIEVVCSHPSTASHIAAKLVRKFVADLPPRSLVERVARVFVQTGGDIRSMLRVILTSDEFFAARGARIKRPFRFVVSCLRAMGADTHAHQPLIEYLTRLGQGLFQYPTPDGYPDEAAPWLGTLLWRWNLAFALAANRIPSCEVRLDRLIDAIGASEGRLDAAKVLAHFIGRGGTARELETLDEFLSGDSENLTADLVGLVMASPAFQRY
jgi:hypothetical protein